MNIAAFVVAVFAFCAPLRAAAPDDSGAGGEPFTPAEFAQAVRLTTSDCTVSETVGPSDVPIPLDLSNALLDRPDLAAFIVRRRRIAPYRIVMRGPRRSFADDGKGTSGVVTLLERTDTHRLYYAEGEHRSAVFPVLRASAVIEMRLEAATGADGRPATRTTLVICVRMRNRFVSDMIEVLRPFLEKTVIGKFTKALFVAERVGRFMAQDPDAAAADVAAYPLLSAEDRADFSARLARLKLGPRKRK